MLFDVGWSGMKRAVLSGRGVRASLEAFVQDVCSPVGRSERRRNAHVYVRGMLGQGGRKSLEPVISRVGGGAVAYESVQHFLADSPWDPAPVMQRLAERVAPQLDVQAWVLDASGWPRHGNHSPGVARQYSGTLGKIGNCQIGVSLHAAGTRGTLPLGWAFYVPEVWCDDSDEVRERRRRAKIPADVGFQTKPELALGLMQAAAGWQIDKAPVLGDAAYGKNTALRTSLHELGFEYVLSIDQTVTVFMPDTRFATKARRLGSGRPPSKREPDRPARSVLDVARDLKKRDFSLVEYRAKNSRGKRCRGRFAFVRVIAAHPVTHDKLEPREEWLIIEWPADKDAPTDYWLSNLPADAPPAKLARLARLRWMIELDYKQLKGHLGLDHYEGRSYLGWHHHACLVTVAHAWLTQQRLDPKARRPA